jgi:hypothetical protein
MLCAHVGDSVRGSSPGRTTRAVAGWYLDSRSTPTSRVASRGNAGVSQIEGVAPPRTEAGNGG